MNKGINRIAAAVGALAIGLSCTGGATTDYPLLPFPRQETPVRLDDLFRGVEITPLETTEASLLSYPELLKTCRVYQEIHYSQFPEERPEGWQDTLSPAPVSAVKGGHAV